jgi:VWFA-related protein
MRERGTRAVVVVSALTLLAALLRAAPQPPQATFRSRISVVPVDVRVIDANGKPVIGLNAGDFIVTEDGVRQELKHFSGYALAAEEAPPPGTPPALRGAPGAEIVPQKGRIFLFVLGRGRLQEPSKGMDALLRFVREQLLPQDQVAMLAWNRATDFTTDHRKVLRTLERFRAGHEEIEARLVHQAIGLQGMYGGTTPAPAVQKKIDELFYGPGGSDARSLAPVPVTDAARVADDTRRITDALQRAEILSTQAIPQAFGVTETALRQADLYNTSFEQYVADAMQRAQDMSSLYTGIEYMRYLEGEKHLVYLTEYGVQLERLEDDLSLAAMANDARVVIDTIQTGGLAGPAPVSFQAGMGSMTVGSVQSSKAPFATQSPSAKPERLTTLQTISALTGGVSSTTAYAASGFGRINDATLSGYLLGYYPTNADWNGRYRKIDVRVNRPGLTVMFRHGYYGRDRLMPLDRRSFITFNRVMAAGVEGTEIKDIKVSVKASASPGEGGALTAYVGVLVDLAAITFAQDGDRRIATLAVTVFCTDSKEDLVGELWQKADLALKEETYQRLLRDGYVHRAVVPLKANAKLGYVKAVVYDYGGDVVGSAILRIK